MQITRGIRVHCITICLHVVANAEVRTLDFDKLMGAGILHTKMWLIDRKHLYVGSANLDWRSLTQVNCSSARSIYYKDIFFQI